MQKKKVKDICVEIISGGTPSTKEQEFWNGDIPWITSADINGTFSVSPKKYITEKAKSKILEPNNILVVTRVGLGKIATNPFPLAFSQDIQGLILKEGHCLPYLLHALSTQVLKFKDIGRGATIKGVTREDLEEIEIPFPDLKTQHEIAHVLEQADKARQQRKAANALTDQFLQGSFLSLFGDPVRNEKGWEVKKVGEVIESIRYGTGSPPEYSDSGIPFIRATNIKKGRIEKPGMVFISDDEATKIEKCRVKKGDWLIVRSGANTGDAAVVTEEYENALAGYDLIVELKYETAIFYNQLINSDYGVKILEPLTRRAGQPHLNSDQIKNLEFYYPPLTLQQQFAGILAQAEQLRQKQRESEKELEHLFQGLLQRYFG